MTPASSNPDHDPDRYLANVFDELTSAPTRSAAIRLSMQAASVLAGADGLCLLTAAGDRCTLALAQRQEIYSCDLRSSRLHRAMVRPHRAAVTGARTLWGKQDSITLSTGEQQAIGATLIVPLEAATAHAAVGFFWRPGRATAPQRTRQLELLAKTLGLAAAAWRKDDENSCASARPAASLGGPPASSAQQSRFDALDHPPLDMRRRNRPNTSRYTSKLASARSREHRLHWRLLANRA